MVLKTLKQVRIKRGMTVILRADFNVPMKNGRVDDDYRILATLPTLRYLLKKGARIVIVCHLGRPNGRDKKLTLFPVFSHLKKVLGSAGSHYFVSDPFGDDGMRQILSMRPRDIAMVENIRFWKGEEENDLLFGKKLACLGEIFINDAFGDSHRKHASIDGIAKFIPAYAGFLLEREVRALERITKYPKRPLVAIIGGAKISTKYDLFRKFLKEANHVLVGGALANSLLASLGISVGRSRFEKVKLPGVRRLSITSTKLHIPVDAVVTKSLEFGKNPATELHGIGAVLSDEYILDIGPETVKLFFRVLKKAKTIVWNGPLGLAEINKFSQGTVNIAKAIKKSRAYSIVGGGDTIAVLRKHRILSGFNHVSTGGGAMLEFLAGKKLPGVEIVRRKK